MRGLPRRCAAIGAAYTGGLPARQRNFSAICGHFGGRLEAAPPGAMKLGKALKRRFKDCPNHGCYALRQVQISGSPGRTASARRGGEENASMTFSGGFDVATGAAHHYLAAPFGYAADLGHD